MTYCPICIYESYDNDPCIYSERAGEIVLASCPSEKVGEVFLLSLLLQEEVGLKTYLQALLTGEELRKVEEGRVSLRDAFRAASVCYLMAGENRATLKGCEVKDRWLPMPDEYL